MSEASAYSPPSREPAEIAARLRAYIARNEAHAQRHVEGEPDQPKIQNGLMGGLLLHVRRVEHQMRCFILFLAAQLIERGLVKPHPLSLYRRGEADPNGPSALIRRQDRQLRAQLSGRVQIATFSVTTPVIEGKRRRHKRRVKAVYKLLPSSVQPVDARHLLARYTRLSRVLLRADVLAERLAGRALTVRLQSPLIPAKAGTSEPPFSQPFNNPLYLRALHSWLAPEPLWESAAEAEDERGDLTALHLMAAESLTSAGLPPGPDPRLRLPRFELWQPPPPPEIHLL